MRAMAFLGTPQETPFMSDALQKINQLRVIVLSVR
jgi:hypothetical protein